MSGLYDPNAFINVTAVDGSTFTGLYARDGSWNVTTAGSGFRGDYHPCGALNVTVVDGSKFVGVTAPDGGLNVFVGNGRPFGCLSVNDVLGTLTGVSILSLNPAFAYDPQNLSTLFVEKSSPATRSGNGSPVGTMLDITPNGNNAIAPSDTARPTLTTGTKNFVTWDGLNNVLNFNGAPITNTNYSIVCAVAFPSTPAANDMIIAGSTGGNDQNTQLGWMTSTDFMFSHWGTSSADAGNILPTVGTAPFVCTAIGQGSTGSFALTLRVNGTAFVSSGTRNPLSSFTGASLGAFPVFNAFTNMKIFRIAVFARALSGNDLTLAESWVQKGF